MADREDMLRDAGSGSAARFFYCAKASKRDREEGLVRRGLLVPDGRGRHMIYRLGSAEVPASHTSISHVNSSISHGDLSSSHEPEWLVAFKQRGRTTPEEVREDMLRDAGGSAARFFYCAKTSKRDREEGLDSAGSRANHHPTVKPTDLMRYLCRLVTPPGGLVLDPFTGSGSTGKAAVLEGFRFLGCELSEEYAAIARSRIAAAQGPGARLQGPDTP